MSILGICDNGVEGAGRQTEPKTGGETDRLILFKLLSSVKRLSDATNVVYCYNRKICQSEYIIKDKETKMNFKGKSDLMEIMYIHSS